MTNSRFTVAIHILCLLALQKRGEPCTSEYIAGSVNTNPVVIRRILALLRAKGLVSSSPGSGGGWLLGRNAEKLMLSDILQALDPEPVFAMHSQAPNQLCPIGRNIQKALKPIFLKADEAISDTLADISIATVLKQTSKHR